MSNIVPKRVLSQEVWILAGDVEKQVSEKPVFVVGLFVCLFVFSFL